MDFNDRHGAAVAYLAEDGETIYLWNDRPVAYLADDSVFSFSGKHLEA